MSDLTLLEAFRHCGPPVDDPAQDRVRREAATVLYSRLTSICRRRGRDGMEDLPATVLLRLIQSGPRHDARYDTDEKVDFYLRRAVQNGFIDLQRRGARTGPVDDCGVGAVVAAGAVGRDAVDVARASDTIAQAVASLFEKVAGTCSGPTQAAIAVRRRVAEGQCTFDDCVREASGEVTTQSRNAFYQRQSRAMRELANAVGPFVAEQRLDEWDALALQVVLQELKDAEAGWRVEEGA